jgi:hypothetical protein
MKKRKTSKATKSRKPVPKKQAQRPAFEELPGDEPTATLDAALTSAEAHLQKLFPKFQPYQVVSMFNQHIQTHLREELDNIVDHGHPNDDPADVPQARVICPHCQHDNTGLNRGDCQKCGLDITQAQAQAGTHSLVSLLA